MRRFESTGYKISDYELSHLIEKYNLSAISPDFLADMAVAFSQNGKARPRSEIISELKSSAPQISRNEHGLLKYQGIIYDTVSEFQTQWATDEYRSAHEPIVDLVSSIMTDVSQIPGNSPFAKAANVGKMLVGMEMQQSLGENLPDLKDETNVEILTQKLQELKTLSKADDWDKTLLGMDDDGVVCSPNQEMYSIILQVEQSIRASSKIRPSPRTRLIKSSSGKVIKTRGSRDFSDFSKAPKRSLILRKRLPLELMKGNIKVPERFERDSRVPLLALLLDKSGSMQRANRHLRGLGVLWFLVKEAEKGNCIGLFSFFEANCLRFHVLDPLQTDLKKWFERICKSEFKMGGTELANCIPQALVEIDRLSKFYEIDQLQKELIVVNDGQDSIGGLIQSDLKGCKLHAITLDCSNKKLGRLATQSGGIYKDIKA
jgi:uncharacterized protein with von Willebrand factor type A (vWA) domain